jgi:hypothetical protein
MTTTNITTKAAARLQSMTTSQLIDTFILTGHQIDAGHHDSNLYTVRGWLMDELERRNPEAMDAWYDSDDYEDETLRQYFPC